MENQNDNQKEIEDRLKQFLHRYYDNQEKHEKAPNFPENTKEFIDRNKEIFDLEVDLKNFSPIKIRSNEKDNNIDILSSNDRNDHINKEEFNKKNINTPKKIEETLNVSIYNDSKLKNTKNNTENYEKSTDIPKINNEIQKKSQDIFGKILVNPYQLVKVDKKKQKITKNNTSFSKKNNNNKNSLSKSPKPTQNKSRSNQKPKLLNKSGEKAKKAVFFANQTMKNHNNLSSCKMNTNKLEEIKKSPRRENGKREIKEFERIKSMESYNNKKKNSKNSVKQNIMFKETFERIDNLNNSGIFLADFKFIKLYYLSKLKFINRKEVNQLIILIKKEKKVILDDITALNNQAKKYKANYLQLV